MSRRALADVVLSTVGSLLVLGALVLIWALRLTIKGDLYVSELGAEGMPTAKPFEVALLMIVVGGSLVAVAGRDIRSRVRILSAWLPSVSLWVSCGFFLVASQVTCTYGCPVPVGAAFDWQDVIHITSATLAFAAACWGIFQSAFAQGHRVLAGFSLVAAILVAVVAGLGGLASLFQFQADFGSRLELAATTIAVAWLVVFGATIAARRIRSALVASAERRQRADIASSSRLASPTST